MKKNWKKTDYEIENHLKYGIYSNETKKNQRQQFRLHFNKKIVVSQYYAQRICDTIIKW